MCGVRVCARWGVCVVWGGVILNDAIDDNIYFCSSIHFLTSICMQFCIMCTISNSMLIMQSFNPINLT